MGKLTQQQASAQKFPAVDRRPPGQRQLDRLQRLHHAGRGDRARAAPTTTRRAEIDNGGLHIVTTFSKPMMNALYATVEQNEKLMAADGKALPWYAHVGALLEQPGTGAVVAMYSGPSYSEPHRHCQRIFCNVDMALANREQVGSSFKPYVLATARAQGMSVKTSVLDGTSPLCVPSDQYPRQYSVPATGPGQAGCPSTPVRMARVQQRRGRQRRRRPAERDLLDRPVAEHRVHRPHPPGGHAERHQHGQGLSASTRGPTRRSVPGCRTRSGRSASRWGRRRSRWGSRRTRSRSWHPAVSTSPRT